jgi:hypothetical protein
VEVVGFVMDERGQTDQVVLNSISNRIDIATNNLNDSPNLHRRARSHHKPRSELEERERAGASKRPETRVFTRRVEHTTHNPPRLVSGLFSL